MILKYPVLLTALVFSLLSFSQVQAGDEGELDLSVLNAVGYQATGESKRCVSYSRIRRTEVVDDYTILFHMAGRKIYANVLNNKCPRLGFERAIKYEVRGGTLCNIDHIEVLTGSIVGPTCRLGSFYEVVKLVEEGEPQALPAAD